jgi:O-antigen ligase
MEKLILLFLILFPFGQVIRLNLYFFGTRIPIHPLDLVAGASLFYLIGKLKKPKIFRQIAAFLFAAAFSYFFSFVIFKPGKFYIGGLYLMRLLAYTGFFLFVFNLVNKKKKLKEVLFNSLILISIATAIFGWIQYFLYPDITTFVVWGWDDHLYRLLGTFLDPGFTSIILVFGFLLSLVKYLKTKNNRLIPLLAFFLLTIAFTYARSGYLALLLGTAIVFWLKRGIKLVLPVVLIFLLIIFLLPRPGGEGVKLERLHSVYSRFENYSETIEIFKTSPIFGVGYNNLCLARQKYLGTADFSSHACSGSDSSLLFVLATTGIVGFLIFANLIFESVKNVDRSIYGQAFLACLGALLIHSFFVNSLFYPWVMGFMGILLSLSLRTSRSKPKG